MSGFSLDTLERSLRTLAQVVAAAVLAKVIDGGGWDAISWELVWKTAAFAALLSVLTSLAAKGTGSPDNASLVK